MASKMPNYRLSTLSPAIKITGILAELADRSNAIARSCGQIWPNQRASIGNRIHTLRL
jgi:hypothetical protein